jgi:hypothetical protein
MDDAPPSPAIRPLNVEDVAKWAPPGRLTEVLSRAARAGRLQLTPELRQAARQVVAEYFDLERTAGGTDAVKALIHGAVPGAIAAAAFTPGAEMGGAAGAFAGGLIGAPTGPGEGVAVPVGGAIGAVGGGLLTSWLAHEAATKALDKLGHYSKTIQAFNDAAARHPNYDAAGNIIGGLANPVNIGRAGISLGAPTGVRTIRSFTQAGRNASEGVLAQGGTAAAARSAAAQAMVRKATTAAAGAVLYDAALRPAMEAAVYVAGQALGFDPKAPTLPTAKSLLEYVALALLFEGQAAPATPKAVTEATARLMARGQAREDLGLPLGASNNSQNGAIIRYLRERGVPVTNENVRQYSAPLTAAESARYKWLSAGAAKVRGGLQSAASGGSVSPGDGAEAVRAEANSGTRSAGGAGLPGEFPHQAVNLPGRPESAYEVKQAFRRYLARRNLRVAELDKLLKNPPPHLSQEQLKALSDEQISLLQPDINDTRGIVARPGVARKVTYEKEIPATFKAQVESGAKLVEAYVHPDLMPAVKEIRPSDTGRSHTYEREIYLTPSADFLTTMHEMMHVIENTHPEVRQACREFLEKRAKGEMPIPLSEITGRPSDGGTMVFVDEWAQKGGTAYTGRDYGKGGNTEILSEGITRLHQDPLRFAKQDPEYFSFVVKTLNKW